MYLLFMNNIYSLMDRLIEFSLYLLGQFQMTKEGVTQVEPRQQIIWFWKKMEF